VVFLPSPVVGLARMRTTVAVPSGCKVELTIER
jgi:hypothetical protein